MAEHPTGDRIRREAIPEELREPCKALDRLKALQPKARKLALQLGMQRPLVFFDLETTGTNTSKDRIVEIATVKLAPGGSTDLRGVRVNPGVPIPPDASEVHGITDEHVADCAKFAEIAPKVAAFMEGCDLAGYNIARFDVPVLEAEFHRADIEFSLEGRRIVDMMRIYHDRERRDLEAAVGFYCRRDIEGAHSAKDDTVSSFEVLLGQLERYPDLSPDLEELDRLARPDPSWFDRDGKLAWRDGELCINFGKHKGNALSEVVEAAPDYLDWILRKDFSQEVKDAIAQTKAGSSPTRDS